MSFRTTDVFLRTFGIASLAELPPLHGDDYAEMEEAAGEAAYSGDEDADGAQAFAPEGDCVMHTFLMVLLWVVLGLLALLAGSAYCSGGCGGGV